MIFTRLKSGNYGKKIKYNHSHTEMREDADLIKVLCCFVSGDVVAFLRECQHAVRSTIINNSGIFCKTSRVGLGWVEGWYMVDLGLV